VNHTGYLRFGLIEIRGISELPKGLVKYFYLLNISDIKQFQQPVETKSGARGSALMLKCISVRTDTCRAQWCKRQWCGAIPWR
jgi:hypothetical protein